MHLDIDEEKRCLLVDLVSSRIAELHPTIRRCRVSTVTDELKHDLEVLEELRRELAEPVAESST
jgi:hypothetical protein